MSVLRPYQCEAIAAVRSEMARGHRRVVLVMPTGAGKTMTACDIVRRALDRGGSVLWLAHRTEIIDQCASHLERYGLEAGVISASSTRNPLPESRVQVASIQTLLARDARPRATLIVYDECHHASEDGAPHWASLLAAYPSTPIVGLTATPERGDGTGLGPLFNGLVVGATVADLTRDGHLVPCRILRPGRTLRSSQIAQDPVDAYAAHAQGRQVLIFAQRVDQAQDIAVRMAAAGAPSSCIHAGTPAGERREAIAAFRSGLIRCLTCVAVLTEGTDLPSAEVCILARGAGSSGVYLQMVGRVLRPAPGKLEALVLDLRGVSHLWGDPSDERVYSLDGVGVQLASRCKKCAVCQAPISAYPCSRCGYAPTSNEPEAAAMEITGDALVPYASKRVEGAAQREATLRRWVKACLDEGKSWKGLHHKYMAVYAEFCPKKRVLDMVKGMVSER